jgi:hypothetical protein
MTRNQLIAREAIIIAGLALTVYLSHIGVHGWAGVAAGLVIAALMEFALRYTDKAEP